LRAPLHQPLGALVLKVSVAPRLRTAQPALALPHPVASCAAQLVWGPFSRWDEPLEYLWTTAGADVAERAGAAVPLLLPRPLATVINSVVRWSPHPLSHFLRPRRKLLG
jgi:hypothetical protein